MQKIVAIWNDSNGSPQYRSEVHPLPLNTDGDVGGLLAMTLVSGFIASIQRTFYAINANLAIII
jgi:hypothetical protein